MMTMCCDSCDAGGCYSGGDKCCSGDGRGKSVSDAVVVLMHVLVEMMTVTVRCWRKKKEVRTSGCLEGRLEFETKN